MNYGANDANSKEALGLIVFIVGLILFSAGGAYAVGIMQPLLDLLGLIAFVGGFVILRAAKSAT